MDQKSYQLGGIVIRLAGLVGIVGGFLPCVVGGAAFLVTVGSEPLRAQSRSESVVVTGIVRDAMSGAPLSGARLRFDRLKRGTLADDAGGFGFVGIPTGIHLLTVEQYGYLPIEATVDVGGEVPVSIDLELDPRPVMLDGLTVVADRLKLMETRFRSRRRAVATSSRAFEQERLLRSPATDLLDFLSVEMSVASVRCPLSRTESRCVLRRGRPIEPRVFIDEAPMIGGVDQLATYRPHDLYLLEVYSLGLEIRAYTHLFMEQMARMPVLLIPIAL